MDFGYKQTVNIDLNIYLAYQYRAFQSVFKFIIVVPLR